MSEPVDVLIICALPEELDALLAVSEGVRGPWTEVASSPPHYAATLDGVRGPIRVAAARLTRAGGVATATVADKLTARLKPSCLAMCGVCAGHPDDTDLGDVIIADRVFQHDVGKRKSSGFEGDISTHNLHDDLLRAAQDLLGAANGLFGYAEPDDEAARWWFLERLVDGRHPQKSGFARYFRDEHGVELLEKLEHGGHVEFTDVGTFALTPDGTREVTRRRARHKSVTIKQLPYHVHVAPIGSGNYVAADGSDWDRLPKAGERKILGIEMEAATVGEIAAKHRLLFVVAKGVMDHGDSKKADQFKAFAARASAEVLCAFLRRVVGPVPRMSEPDGRNAQIFEGPLPERHFTGRTTELAHLELLLQDHRGVCVVATGLGGIGKTTLVSQFVQLRGSDLFPDGVAWIDGNPDRLNSELARVAKRFGWDVTAAGRDPTPEEAVRHLNVALANKRVLLVVDSFDPEQSSTDYVPQPWPDSRTVVTSRTRTLDQKLDAARLELDLWPFETCREYLRERCRSDCHWTNTVEDKQLDELAEFVGRLPLGVRLLVSVLRNRPGIGPTETLATLKEQALGVLDRFDENRGVAATFRAGYDALSELRRQALQALAACARQTREDIIADVGELDDARDALNWLRTHGFAELYADGRWGLHDVVRMFVLTQPGADAFVERQLAWVRRHLAAHADPTAFRAFAEGVDEATHAFRYWVARDVAVAVGVYIPLEDHLRVVGRYAGAIDLSRLMLAAATPQSAWAANSLNQLGVCYLMLRDIPKAIECHNHGLAIDENLGHLRGQATHLGNLGTCYQTLRNIPTALGYHRRALFIDRKIGHLEGQANHLSNLGVCHLTFGDILNAIDYLVHALAIDEKLGRLEPQANHLGNLGVCYWKLALLVDATGNSVGNIHKAIDFLQRGLAIDEKLGRLHGQAAALSNLGGCFLSLGNTDRAIGFLQRSLAIDEKLGRLEEQAKTLAGLGSITARSDDTPDRARDYLARALALSRQIGLQTDDPTVVLVVDTLAFLK